MAKVRTPRLTTDSSNKQVIPMPGGDSPLALRRSGAAIVPPPAIDLEVQIRLRAYELYEERGRTPGQENDDWLRAEREVLARQNHHPIASA